MPIYQLTAYPNHPVPLTGFGGRGPKLRLYTPAKVEKLDRVNVVERRPDDKAPAEGNPTNKLVELPPAEKVRIPETKTAGPSRPIKLTKAEVARLENLEAPDLLPLSRPPPAKKSKKHSKFKVKK